MANNANINPIPINYVCVAEMQVIPEPTAKCFPFFFILRKVQSERAVKDE